MADSKFSKYFTNLGVDVGVILVSEKFAGCIHCFILIQSIIS
jgi:hypothetical protein